MTQENKPSNVSLLTESTTFTRIPNPNGEGELLEVKVTTKVRTAMGIMHDTTQSFVLTGEGASDTLASLRVIHNNIQLALVKLAEESSEEGKSEGADLETASA